MQHFSGREYLAIDIANNFGLDKKLWSERLDWFKQHESALELLVPKADEPALYYAGVKAYRDVQQGKPIGYCISLDATSSGLQLLAVLCGDRKAAEICNVVDTGKRADAYTVIYEAMLAVIGGEAKIKREHTKKAVMTSLYGSTAMPKKVFGPELVKLFEATMEQNAPGAWKLNKLFLDIWKDDKLSNDWVLPDNFHVHVKVMVNQEYMVNFLNEPFEVTRQVNGTMEKGRSLGANTIHSLDGMVVREMARRCNYDAENVNQVREIFSGKSDISNNKDNATDMDKMVVTLWKHYQESGYLSARILDYITYLNAGHVDSKVIMELIDSLPKKPFKVFTVHDCFKCLPTYGDDLRKQYNIQLHLIAKSNMLNFILEQLLGKATKLKPIDPTLADDVLNSEYALS
jgi:hypothetical protein